ncbi:MAG TPA: zinc dependent phospholipase C family protein [Gemmatimonadales bacterium]|nr:zinc dependent phospholipase C family protein [Gemmatimonadales bacterium]
MSPRRVATAFVALGLALLILPDALHAWTPGTHIYLAQGVLSSAHLLPPTIADLIRAFPYDFLYGNIAADSTIAKNFAPVSRHCHHWHVGQEIHDLAPTDGLRAFGLGYLSHLAADTVAHNYFVPRQLAITSTTQGFGHAYWESRFETHLGPGYAHTAKEVIQLEHTAADGHLDQIISPTIFSVRTNRRIFRGMVHLVETRSWQRAFRMARERSRWDLSDPDIARHMALSYEYIMETLADDAPAARRLDPAGAVPLRAAKVMRREALIQGGRRDATQLHETADRNFGLPHAPDLAFWKQLTYVRPWEESRPGPPNAGRSREDSDAA